jgi:23S rRNA (uracil1939-C5)-methyltransferase
MPARGILIMAKCPLVNICGGCKYDFTNDSYHDEKISELPKIKFTDKPIWGIPGTRRRADFAFGDGHFGFFKNKTKDIVDVKNCPGLVPEINSVLLDISKLPWVGAGGVLITKCENGIDVGVSSSVPYYNADFKKAVDKLPSSIIRFSWNDKIVRQYMEPEIKFDEKIVKYPTGAFLQPTIETEKILRDMVVKYVNSAKKVVDLFCGLGNFTFATNATGFDIFGNGIKRDLFKNPLSAKNLNQYDVIVMDPPRAGAMAQSKEIAKSDVKRVIYISCNPNSFIRDQIILERGGYKMSVAIPVDQFIGSSHWEIFSVFEK